VVSIPVLVIGADTDLGRALVPALRSDAAELRVFCSDPAAAEPYRGFAKIAVGDISDGTHVGGAATGAYCAVVIAAAAHDARERAFATDTESLFGQWAGGLAEAEVHRIIVVGERHLVPDPDPLSAACSDYHTVDTADRAIASVVDEIVSLEAAR